MSILETNKINPIAVNASISKNPSASIEQEATSTSSDMSTRAGQRRLRTETFVQQNNMNLQVADSVVAIPKPEEIAEILLKYNAAPSQALLLASKNGDIDSVRKLLDYGVDPVSGENYNVLDSACEGNSLALLKYLIEEKGLLPTKKDPFHSLISRKHPFFEAIDYFQSNGFIFSEDAIFSSFYKSTVNSFEIPNVETIKFLISRGATVDCLINPKFSDKSKDILVLIFCGPRLKERVGGEGRFHFDIAESIASDLNLFNLLCSFGIDVNKEIPFVIGKKIFNPPTDGNQCRLFEIYNTPLLAAIANHDIALVQNLINGGANVNFEGQKATLRRKQGNRYVADSFYDPPTRCTPLQLAIDLNHKDLITLLLMNGAKI